MRFFVWSAVMVVGLLGFAACGGDGGGGEGGSGAGEVCTGNKAVWDAIEKQPPGNTTIPCTTNADCCFVENSCLCDFFVVSAKDYQSAQDDWPVCPEDCAPDCIYQPKKPECVNGMCITTEGGDPAQGYLYGSQCGK